MSDPIVSRIHDWLTAHEQELIETTRTMLRIPSLESEAQPNAPFGAENRRALDLALKLGQDFGMRTKDLDGYAGYAEIGEGEKLILSLGHLDVVPVSNTWKHEPFGATLEDGYIYARGSTDDKGPTMASFFAIRALKECFPDLKVRVRQVFGCNEESGFKCVHHYVEKEGAPTYGVAPDSGWPLYHGEKNIGTPILSAPLFKGSVALKSATGGERTNIVLDHAVGVLWVSPAARAEVEAHLADAWDRNVTTQWEGEDLQITSTGRAAHGAHPFGGDSAATRLFRFLEEIVPLDAKSYFGDLMEATHPSGVGIGIHGRDEETGDLTSNLGVLTTEGDRLTMAFSVRYPVTWSAATFTGRLEARAAELGWKVESCKDSRGLYFPLDHPLVKTILDVHEAETGTRGKPGVMGGGTYARAVPNCVSIGTCWEGDGYAHEDDERIKAAHLLRAAKIYGHLFYKLSILP